jgi:hypothetical protein
VIRTPYSQNSLVAKSQHRPLLAWFTLGPGYSPLGPRPLRGRLNTFSSLMSALRLANDWIGSECDKTNRESASVGSCVLGMSFSDKRYAYRFKVPGPHVQSIDRERRA